MKKFELLCFVEMPINICNYIENDCAIAVRHDFLRFGIIYNEICYEAFIFREYNRYLFWKSEIILNFPSNFLSFKILLPTEVKGKILCTQISSFADIIFIHNSLPYRLKRLRIRNSETLYSFLCFKPNDKWNGRISFSRSLIEAQNKDSNDDFYLHDYTKISSDWCVDDSNIFFSFIDVEYELNFFRREILNDLVWKIREKFLLEKILKYNFFSTRWIIQNFKSIAEAQYWKDKSMFIVDLNKHGIITCTKINSKDEIDQGWEILFGIMGATYVYFIRQATCLELFVRKITDVL